MSELSGVHLADKLDMTLTTKNGGSSFIVHCSHRMRHTELVVSSIPIINFTTKFGNKYLNM